MIPARRGVMGAPRVARNRGALRRMAASLIALGAGWCLLSCVLGQMASSQYLPCFAKPTSPEGRATEATKAPPSDSKELMKAAEKERTELEAQRQVFLALDEEQWGLDSTSNTKAISSAVAEKVKKETEERMESWWWQIGEQASRPAGIIVAAVLVLALGYWVFATEAGQEAFYWSVQRERQAKMESIFMDEEFQMDFRNIDRATLAEIIEEEKAKSAQK
mmetsp:Transcript_54097/g.128832  ORF Transcript_54097/g.128832 Transcript_54097/m.128832 type:complete len:220 (-) Transcript_54097:118-777(-)